MDRVTQTNTEAQPTRSSGLPQPLPVVLSALLCAAAVTAVVWWLRNGPADSAAQPQGPPPQQLFVGWPKPDVALLLSGESRGYLQPCGCSEPQKGGLARRYAFLQSLRQKGWPVIAADLGDIPEPGHPQSMLKYVTAMQALRLMDYTAVTFGKREMSMPLVDALAEYALNNPAPRVVGTNLLDRDKDQLFAPMVSGWAV